MLCFDKTRGSERKSVPCVANLNNWALLGRCQAYEVCTGGWPAQRLHRRGERPYCALSSRMMLPEMHARQLQASQLAPHPSERRLEGQARFPVLSTTGCTAGGLKDGCNSSAGAGGSNPGGCGCGAAQRLGRLCGRPPCRPSGRRGAAQVPAIRRHDHHPGESAANGPGRRWAALPPIDAVGCNPAAEAFRCLPYRTLTTRGGR